MMKSVFKYLLQLLRHNEAFHELAKPVSAFITLVMIMVVAWLAFQVTKMIVNLVISRLARHTKTDWDDILFKNRVFIRMAHIVPAFIIYQSAGFAFPDIQNIDKLDEASKALIMDDHYFKLAGFIINGVKIYLIAVVVLISVSFLNAVYEIFNTTKYSHHRSIKGYVQILKILILFIAGILAISVILDKDPTVLLAGLGAMAAVLILVFKDTILGFVASIQISANDMVKIGDWIEIPKNNVNGNVIDITLNTVKIRNFDNSITTVPTYSMVSESFINWKGLEAAEGRRIKRAIPIDLGSIKFCSDELLEKLSKFELIKGYIAEKQAEIEKHNEKKNIASHDLLSGRKQTNIGIFRKYLELYLKQNPMVNKNMTMLVRQLDVAGKGLPIEIYLFSKDKNWENYEAIQADIFDHIFAIVPVFELKIFQEPTSVKII